MTRIALGHLVKDVITGVQGIAVCIQTELNGNRRITIQQPAKEDGTVPEAHDHDEVGVDYIDEGFAGRAAPTAFTPVKLGDKVTDIAVPGFEGVATTRIDYLNGCVRFWVNGPLNRNMENAVAQLDHARLRVVGTVPEVAEVPKTRTGGPRTRSLVFGRRT